MARDFRPTAGRACSCAADRCRSSSWSRSCLSSLVAAVRADRAAAARHARPDQPRRRGRALRLRRQFRRAVLRQRRLHGGRRLCLGAADHEGRGEVACSCPTCRRSSPAAEWPTLARRAGRRRGGGARRARRRLAADAPLRHFGEHRDLRRARHHLRRARQLDLGDRRPELADGPAALCRPVDRGRLGCRGDRHRLRLSGDALAACCSAPRARTRRRPPPPASTSSATG